VRLRERPELRVDGTRLVDTNNINADGLTAYGGEVGWFWNNLYLAGEYYLIDVDRTGTGPANSDLEFNGWYAQGAWTLTGEKHEWNPAAGGFKGIKPAKPLGGPEGGSGAWEIAARYSVLDLNDNEGAAGGGTPVGGIRGGEQTISTLGLNWYPNNVVRFLLDYQNGEIDRLNGGGAEIGEDFQAVSLRTQVAF
jgi:phosphate-selective porin OprO/OprP